MARSDVQLMLDVKAGDDSSFDFLLRKYRSPLVNFLYRMVRDRATAEDLAQDVFLRVYLARKEYVPSAKFTTWLFRIATNVALNSVRDNRHQKMQVLLGAPVADEQDPAPRDLPAREMRIDEHLLERDRFASGETARSRSATQIRRDGLRGNRKSSGLHGSSAEIAALPGV